MKKSLRLDSIKSRNLYFFLPLNVLNPRLLNFLGHVLLETAGLFFVPTLPWIFLWHPSSVLVARLLNNFFQQSDGKKLLLFTISIALKTQSQNNLYASDVMKDSKERANSKNLLIWVMKVRVTKKQSSSGKRKAEICKKQILNGKCLAA